MYDCPQVHYDLYNQKFGADGMHESLHFHEADEEVNQFREKYILPYIIKTEATEKPMLEWLQHLAEFCFETREVNTMLLPCPFFVYCWCYLNFTEIFIL